MLFGTSIVFNFPRKCVGEWTPNSEEMHKHAVEPLSAKERKKVDNSKIDSLFPIRHIKLKQLQRRPKCRL